MGTYDTIGENQIQVKIDQLGINYSVGSTVPYEDGLYLGYEGFFVVYSNKIICEGIKVFDKWGNNLDTSLILDQFNPITRHMNDKYSN